MFLSIPLTTRIFDSLLKQNIFIETCSLDLDGIQQKSMWKDTMLSKTEVLIFSIPGSFLLTEFPEEKIR
jgi:hypothetical protein